MGKKRNLQLPECVDAELDREASAGTSITRTVSAAVYWYFSRLDAHQRELARHECAEWMETGTVPPRAIASEMEESLRNARARELRRSGRRSTRS